jgi:acyl transferase domain-containing protein/acyl-CoA synthetase (AMP-forming)/AMP-acid ligase II/aryl carrier-like protein
MSTTKFDPAATATIVDVLRYRAAHQPDQLAYTFLEDGEAIGGQLTYAELDRGARAVASVLQQRARPGDRVLLTYPQGLEFVVAFFGCLYCGVISIPAPLPDRGRIRRTLERLQAIADDADARFILTTTSSLPIFDELADAVGAARFAERLATDIIALDAAANYRMLELASDALAYLQYTSGSTTYPRGVMVGHRHLIVNSAAIARASPYGPDCRTVTWLPYFHDYGLVEGLLQPLFSGFPCWFFSPQAFVERPLRWLSAVSRFRATHSQAPSFAFALAVAKIGPAERRLLDLKSWRVAGNGSEPIHADTAIRFVEAFAPQGFRRDAFCPEYGLAEATLIVSYKRGGQVAVVRPFDIKALEQNRVQPTADDAPGSKRIASCGQTLDNVRVEIVDPKTSLAVPPRTVGEIWVAAPSITPGYWQRPDDTVAVFDGRLADSGEGPFLRTGDLGFLLDGELYVTGRVKDLIIVHGVNYYPQDIEETVERSHPAIRPGCSAAFAVEVAGEERLVVMAESRAAREEIAEIEAIIREQIVLNHGLALDRLVLIDAGALPKTSSGKKQRSAARIDYIQHYLHHGADKPKVDASPTARTVAGQFRTVAQTLRGQPLSAAQIATWLRTWLAARVGAPLETINERQSFASFGLVSIDAIELAADVKAWLNRPLSPTAIYDYGTPSALARMLAGDETRPGAGWEHAQSQEKYQPLGVDNNLAATDENSVSPQSPSSTPGNACEEPIAIVGLACRFPGADTPEEFWQNLAQGVVSIQEVPSDRWSISEHYDPRPRQPGKTISKWGGFLEHVDRFDARFFGISPYEAERMDPQQRLLLELAWEVLEHAGHSGAKLTGSSTGVFLGASVNEYARNVTSQLASLGGLTASGNYLAVIANRISYFLGVGGPSLAIDTACSSSLVAVHLAVQSLRQQECSTALVGGVQVLLAPDIFIDCSQAGMLAPDGLCKPFDDRANGFVRGEGGALVLLKRLSDAQRDGDTIHAVIRGTAVNHDGHTNGLTAPSSAAQALLIRRAHEVAGVPPETIGYVEAHGTGTALGDPIEVEALTQAFSAVERSQYCALGSVKSNIGHLEPAAGVAGLLKVVLSLVHGELPPTLHLTSPNRHLLLESSPFYVVDRRRAWSAALGPRRAGVSSFGFGGTNAHVVLEQAPEVVIPDSTSGAARDHLFVLSARSEAALRRLVDTHSTRSIPDNVLADLCFTLQVGRAHFAHRLAIVARSGEELKRKLAAAADRAGGFDAPADGIFTNTTSAGVLGQLACEPASSSAESAPGDGQAPTRLMALRYVAGDDLDWSVLHVGWSPRHVPAPTYPFERQRYWLDRPQAAIGRDEASAPDSDKKAKAGHESPAPPASAHAIEKLLQESVAHALGFRAAEIGLATNIQELGLNSILAAKAATEVSRRCGLELEAIDFFLQPTLGRLAAQLSAVPEWRSVFGGGATTPTDQTRSGDTSAAGAVAPSPVASQATRNQEQRTAALAEADFHVRLPLQSQSRGFTASTAVSRDIAVIGMACRFPGADSPEALWRNLLAGVDAVGPLPPSRRSDAGVGTSTDDSLPFAWRHGGFLDDVAGFDAQLFAISPHEARRMDPQQRLFLECCWQTLERAGYAPTGMGERRVGVFAGVSTSDYARIWDRQGSGTDAHFGSGTALAMVANRASYLLNLVGPSVSIDTACSGSLVALALACESLRTGACRMALAGGVNLILAPELSDALAQGGMLSPSGRCQTFDDHADGYVRSEGVGVVLLKPLTEALADRDQVLAVIKGLAVNHDGHDKPGLTAPSLTAQTELLSAAYEDAGVDPRSVTYVEAHGTGTALGDPIELAALRAVCGHDRAAGSCALGATKSSLGHLEAAAGIAGFIKTVLAISHGIIPPSLHFQAPNRRFEWAGAPFYVTDRPRDWTDERRRSGVSSFGFGGANVHVVLEAVSSEERASCKRAQPLATTVGRSSLARIVAASSANLLVLSAETTTALRTITESYLSYLNLPGGASLDDLCFTANRGRGVLRHRLAIVARYRDQLADRLRHLRDWEERGRLQGSLVFASEDAGSFTNTAETTSHSDQVLELWRARCAQLTSDVIEALGSCVGGSLWQDHLLPISRRYYDSANLRSSSSTVTFREEEAIELWSALGQLFVWGVDVDWTRVYAGTTRRRVLLPTYPFERQRYWLDGLPVNRESRETPSRASQTSGGEEGDFSDPLDMAQHCPTLEQPRPTNVEADVVTCLIEMLAAALEADAGTIDPHRPVVELGVDSFLAVDMARRLSRELQHTISPTILYETGSLAALAARLIADDAEAAKRLASAARRHLNSGFRSVTPAIAQTSHSTQGCGVELASFASHPTAFDHPHIGRSAGAEPIAIIGVGVRVPGASTLAELWALVRNGHDLVAPVTAERWQLFATREEEAREAIAAGDHSAALLPSLEWFDPQFFRLSPREAEEMDPQQRLLLETAWEALESAGYAGGALSGASTGVFVGGMGSEYLARLLAMPEQLGAYAVTGNTLSILANRLSYLLNLTGPCLALDTACSSSLVALHLAIESLRRGECESALVAGAQVGLAPSHFRLMRSFGGLSPRGRCRPFAQGADGYVLGEGTGVVVLKPLARALADGDHVLAVIRGAAVNHGGQAAGLTVPNPAAQAKVVRAALTEAQLSAEDITLVESHGTGTALGDPLEVQGLLEAYRVDSSRSQFCALGSIKSNLGHLEPAAGILGLIKLIAALCARELPPTLHVDEPNRSISFADSPFYVSDRARPWNSPAGVPRRAGVSSFGYGGTNAHVIVEEGATSSAVHGAHGASDTKPQVLVLSARSVAALKKLAARFAEQLVSSTQPWLDFCWTAATGRPHWPQRLAVVASNAQTAARQLGAFAEQDVTIANKWLERANQFHFCGDASAANSIEQETRRQRLHESRAELPADAQAVFDRYCSYPGQTKLKELPPNDAATSLALSAVAQDTSVWRAMCEALAVAYALGAEIDWRSLLIGQSPRRVPLPTYPFERQRLWRDFPGASTDAAKVVEVVPPAQTAQADEPTPALAPWLHVIEWRTTPRGELQELSRGIWIVFDDETTLGNDLIARIRAAGAQVVRVVPREDSSQFEIDWQTPREGRMEIAPDARKSYVRLFDAIARADAGQFAGVVHLWSQHRSIAQVSPANAPDPAKLCSSAAWRLSVTSSLRLLQALSTATSRPSLGTWFVTGGAHEIGPDEMADPVATAVWGVVRAAERERSDLVLRLRDLPVERSAHDVQQLIDDLHDMASPFQCGWRDGKRYTPGLAPWIAPIVSEFESGWPVAADGVYLISGGLGAIGLAVSESLVEQGARKLVLLSRRGMPSEPANNNASLVVTRLREFGARVWTPLIDVCERAEIERLVDQVSDELGPVRGVVHAAGVLADRLLPNVEPKDLEQVLAPKLNGVANLLAAISGDPLDFFVVLSSLAGHVGNGGQIAYAAASSCLDSWVLAARRHYASAHLSLVDLGPWGEAGMAMQAAARGRGRNNTAIHSIRPRHEDGELLDATRQFWQARGMELIPPRIGCKSLALAAREGLRQLVVAKETVPAVPTVSRASSADFRPLGEISRGTIGVQRVPQVAIAGDHTIGSCDISQMRPRLRSLVAEVAAATLRLPADQIDHEKEFREHGLDSLMADEVVRRLRQTLQLPDLRVGELFARPTVASLADWLCVRFAEHLENILAVAECDPKSPTVDASPTVENPSTSSNTRAASLHRKGRDVAVIGYACRFPGAADATAFGELVREQRSAVGPMPPDRWQAACRYDPQYAATFGHEPPVGAFLTDIDRFDPEFFRIAPTEAAQIDPRQRAFLEVAYHAAEHAGYGGNALRGASCGVFVGTGCEDYYAGVASELFGEHAAPGGTAAALPGRLAYFLDLHGPALAIDTACSSSLVALHHAVGSVRRGECDYAFVGGVHLHVRLYSYISLRRMGALSPHGVCRPFDRRADGFVPGEGVAALLVRPLADALAAGDTVYGVIRGSAVNNDGRSNGMLAPNPLAQTRLLQTAWADAEIEPDSISYLEAHGTGTLLGDPVEWGAIDEALRTATHRRQFVSIGGVKSNIGHADAAAGLAGVIKILLNFEQRELLPTRGFVEPNPRFDAESSPLVLADRVRRWQPKAPDGSPLPRRAGVSSFGFAGTNAHVVLEEPPVIDNSADDHAIHVLTLSAQDETSLRRLAADYAVHLEENPQLRWLDVCHTANLGRAHLRERMVVFADNCREGIEALQAFVTGGDDATSVVNACDPGRHSVLYVRSGEEAEAIRDRLRRVLRDRVAELSVADLQQLRAVSAGQLAAELLGPANSEQRALESVTSSVPIGADAQACHTSKPVLQAAAGLFALGAAINWSQVEDYSTARRVALPLYPYRDERYWLDMPRVDKRAETAPTEFATSDIKENSKRIDNLLAVPDWKPCNVRDNSLLVMKGRWLVVGEHSKFATELTQQLRDAGCEVDLISPEWVAANLEFGTIGAGNAIVVEQFRRALMEKLGERDRWSDIAFCALPEAAESDEPSRNECRVANALSRNLAGLLALIHASQNSVAETPTNLWVLTAGAQAVTGGRDCLHPENAALWGVARVIPRECPHLRVRSIDVDAHEARLQSDEAVRSLVGEFARHTPAVEVAYRNRTRYVLKRQPLPESLKSAAKSIRRGGVYLITGGLGGIGLVLARWLAECYQARIVLLSRTALPSRDRWSATVADHDASAQLRSRLAELVAIEAAGGEVMVVAGDVADRAALHRAEHAARERFGAINGVFHAAGTARKCLLRDTTFAGLADAIRPKVAGAVALIEWAHREPFDFVLFFSSIAGLDGNVFQAEYSAANRTLDALAAAARANGLPIQSIAWDLWQGIGMGRGMAEVVVARGRAALNPADALAALERALAWGYPEISVRASSAEIGQQPTIRESAPSEAAAPIYETRPSVLAESQSIKSAPELSTELDSDGLRIRVRRALREAVAATLGLAVERVGVEQSLPDLGLDSLLAVKFMRGLSQATGKALSATLPFDFASIALLAEHLNATLPAQSLEEWLKLGVAESARPGTGHAEKSNGGDVLELQSGRRVRILSRRGPVWPG